MIKVFMLNPKAERQASPGVPYVELSDYLSLESRHRDLVALLRRIESDEWQNMSDASRDLITEALKEEQ